jgi:hypothetical protein
MQMHVLFDILSYLDCDGLVVGFLCGSCQSICAAGVTGVMYRVFVWNKVKKVVVCGRCFERGVRSASVRPSGTETRFQTVTK